MNQSGLMHPKLQDRQFLFDLCQLLEYLILIFQNLRILLKYLPNPRICACRLGWRWSGSRGLRDRPRAGQHRDCYRDCDYTDTIPFHNPSS